jgi:hypothetical protein
VNRYLSKVLSYIFHPLLMPSYGVLIFYQFDMFLPKNVWPAFFIVMFFTFLLPVLNILFLYSRKYIPSLEMHTAKERRLPYLATALIYTVSITFLRLLFVSPAMKLMILAATASLVMVLILNYFMKISAHMVGIGGLTGAVFVFSYVNHIDNVLLVGLLFLVSGVLAVARLSLEAHRPVEIYLGFVLGALLPIGFMLLSS